MNESSPPNLLEIMNNFKFEPEEKALRKRARSLDAFEKMRKEKAKVLHYMEVAAPPKYTMDRVLQESSVANNPKYKIDHQKLIGYTLIMVGGLVMSLFVSFAILAKIFIPKESTNTILAFLRDDSYFAFLIPNGFVTLSFFLYLSVIFFKMFQYA